MLYSLIRLAFLSKKAALSDPGNPPIKCVFLECDAGKTILERLDKFTVPRFRPTVQSLPSSTSPNSSVCSHDIDTELSTRGDVGEGSGGRLGWGGVSLGTYFVWGESVVEDLRLNMKHITKGLV